MNEWITNSASISQDKKFLSFKDQPVKAVREVIAVYSEDYGNV
jgi:hypothetical protein